MLLCHCKSTEQQPEPFNHSLNNYVDDLNNEGNHEDNYDAVSLLYITDWAKKVFVRATVFVAFLFNALVVPMRSAKYVVYRWSTVRRSTKAAGSRCFRTPHPHAIAIGFTWTVFLCQVAFVVAVNLLVLTVIYRPTLRMFLRILGLLQFVLSPFAS